MTSTVAQESATQAHFNDKYYTCRIDLFIYDQSPLEKTTLPPSSSGVTCPTTDWLEKTLLPKVLQWSQESRGVSGGPGKGESLIPMDRYSRLYQNMKSKYGPPIIKVRTYSLTP